jgi:hypothetical protein
VARGWESKSVEEQQTESFAKANSAKKPRTPEEIQHHNQRQSILLSRQRVLQQLESVQNPRHREMLNTALADLDAQLKRLE